MSKNEKTSLEKSASPKNKVKGATKSLQLNQAMVGEEEREQEKQRKRKLLAGRRRLEKGKKVKEEEKQGKETETNLRK